jgi:hypothetical protein
MIKEIKSSKELLEFINTFPISKEEKDELNLLFTSWNSMININSNYDSNKALALLEKIFDDFEKILNNFFSQDEKIDSFKKSNNIDRIIISITDLNNNLYATV